MHVTTDEAGTIHVTGAMDVDSETELLRVFAAHPSPVVVDLAGLTRIDEAGVRLLVRCVAKGPVLLVNVPPFALDALREARAMDLPGFVVVPDSGCP